MKTHVLSLILFFGIAQALSAMPGPEIPKPGPSLEQATQNVRKHYREVYIKNFNNRQDWHKEFFVDSVVYKRTKELKWYWFITLRHPRGNDHSVTFRVERDGKVAPIPETVTM